MHGCCASSAYNLPQSMHISPKPFSKGLSTAMCCTCHRSRPSERRCDLLCATPVLGSDSGLLSADGALGQACNSCTEHGNSYSMPKRGWELLRCSIHGLSISAVVYVGPFAAHVQHAALRFDHLAVPVRSDYSLSSNTSLQQQCTGMLITEQQCHIGAGPQALIQEKVLTVT